MIENPMNSTISVPSQNPQSDSDKIICQNCAARCTSDAAFCSKCGTKLVTVQPSSEQVNQTISTESGISETPKTTPSVNAAPSIPTQTDQPIPDSPPTISPSPIPIEKMACGCGFPPVQGNTPAHLHQDIKPKSFYTITCNSKDGTSSHSEVTRDSLMIGSAVDSDLQIPNDPCLSRHHANISIMNGSLKITDLGSTNGTYIKVTEPKEISRGSVILMGTSLLRID